MAVTNEKSPQHTPPEGSRNKPIDRHGKYRECYFSFTQGAAAGDANSTAELCRIPPGRIRLLPGQSRISTSAFGAGRTLNIGLREYPLNNLKDRNPENASTLTPGGAIDVSTAVANAAIDPKMKHDIFAGKEVSVFATVLGGTIPVGATIEGFIAYVAE